MENVTLMGAIGTFADAANSVSSSSLPSYTSPARVEPVVLVEGSLRELPIIQDCMHSTLNLIAGYYLQAVALTVNVGKVDVLRLLDKLNNKRKPYLSASSTVDRLVGTEGYRDGFPTELSRNLIYGTEARDATERSANGFGRNTVDKLYDDSNLSVGKLLEIDVESNNHRAQIPVAMRLMARTLPSSSLIPLMSLGMKDRSAKRRFTAWRAGELQFMRDLVMCQDIIDDHRKAMRADKSGTFRNNKAQRRSNKLSALLSLTPSVNDIANVAVVSRMSIGTIERETGGKVSKFRHRNKLMEELGLMLLVVVDPEDDTVEIYAHDIDGSTELTAREMKSATKRPPDITELMKTFMTSSAPRF